jgi:hypothetical protein
VDALCCKNISNDIIGKRCKSDHLAQRAGFSIIGSTGPILWITTSGVVYGGESRKLPERCVVESRRLPEKARDVAQKRGVLPLAIRGQQLWRRSMTRRALRQIVEQLQIGAITNEY